MRIRIFLLPMLALSLALAFVARAHAEEHDCDGTTVESLHHCVQHAIEMGHVTNAGVGKSLLAKTDAAQAAVERQQPGVAERVLDAFINEVEAQAGVHIEADHAEHMIMHAEAVIDAL